MFVNRKNNGNCNYRGVGWRMTTGYPATIQGFFVQDQSPDIQWLTHVDNSVDNHWISRVVRVNTTVVVSHYFLFIFFVLCMLGPSGSGQPLDVHWATEDWALGILR
jgi:hypothetical protein